MNNICERCGNDHDGSFGSGRFCSKSCANKRTHSEKTKMKISKSLGGVGFKGSCANCGNDLPQTKRIYCSRSCQNDFQYKEYIKKWKNGEESGMSGEFSISAHIKRYLRTKCANKCSECGWDKINITTGKVPLHIHHIDGNWKNNLENNLIVLCPNCHSLTPTYCSLNKGSGRKKQEILV